MDAAGTPCMGCTQLCSQTGLDAKYGSLWKDRLCHGFKGLTGDNDTIALAAVAAANLQSALQACGHLQCSALIDAMSSTYNAMHKNRSH